LKYLGTSAKIVLALPQKRQNHKKLYTRKEMKRSDIFEFISPDTEGAIIDSYAVSDLTHAMSSFLHEHYHDSIKITSSFNSISRINIQGYKTAALLRRILTIDRADETLNIHLSESSDMLYIIIGTKVGLKIDEEEKIEIIDLARAAGFYININEEPGIITIKCETHSSSVTLSAQDKDHPFYKELERAFMK
jgi:hypothetical protein